jgi:hypothetical protein
MCNVASAPNQPRDSRLPSATLLPPMDLSLSAACSRSLPSCASVPTPSPAGVGCLCCGKGGTGGAHLPKATAAAPGAAACTRSSPASPASMPTVTLFIESRSTLSAAAGSLARAPVDTRSCLSALTKALKDEPLFTSMRLRAAAPPWPCPAAGAPVRNPAPVTPCMARVTALREGDTGGKIDGGPDAPLGPAAGTTEGLLVLEDSRVVRRPPAVLSSRRSSESRSCCRAACAAVSSSTCALAQHSPLSTTRARRSFSPRS